MSINKKTSIAFLSLSMCMSMAHKVFADNNFAVEYSQGHRGGGVIFNRLDVRKAIAAVCRLLRLDPSNKTARENFDRIAASSILSAQQRSDIMLIENLIKNIENLTKRIDRLKVRRDFLKDQLISNGHAVALLNGQLLSIKGDHYHPFTATPVQERPFIDQDLSLNLIKGLMNEENKHLYEELIYLQHQHQWLSLLAKGESSIRPEPFDTAQKIVIDVLSDQNFITDYEHSVNTAETAVAVDLQNIDEIVMKLKFNESEKTHEQDYDNVSDLNELKKMLTQKDETISDLSNQVINLSLKISEVELLLNKKIEEIALLQKQMVDVEQRFMLEKRIIREKNEEIQALQDSLDRSRLQTDEYDHNVSISSGEKLREIGGDLEIYKYEIGKERLRTKKKVKDVRVLKEQLLSLQSELHEKKNALDKTQSDLNILKERLTTVELKVPGLKEFPKKNEL